jgi:hypothetical protein
MGAGFASARDTRDLGPGIAFIAPIGTDWVNHRVPLQSLGALSVLARRRRPDFLPTIPDPVPKGEHPTSCRATVEPNARTGRG